MDVFGGAVCRIAIAQKSKRHELMRTSNQICSSFARFWSSSGWRSKAVNLQRRIWRMSVKYISCSIGSHVRIRKWRINKKQRCFCFQSFPNEARQFFLFPKGLIQPGPSVVKKVLETWAKKSPMWKKKKIHWRPQHWWVMTHVWYYRWRYKYNIDDTFWWLGWGWVCLLPGA